MFPWLRLILNYIVAHTTMHRKGFPNVIVIENKNV